MRLGSKSSFVDVLKTFSPPSQDVPTNSKCTMDGGFLLHKVTRPSPASYAQVCEAYVAYVKSYGQCSVVFDGYCSGPSTKDEAHLRTLAGLAKKAAKTKFWEVAKNTN